MVNRIQLVYTFTRILQVILLKCVYAHTCITCTVLILYIHTCIHGVKLINRLVRSYHDYCKVYINYAIQYMYMVVLWTMEALLHVNMYT